MGQARPHLRRLHPHHRGAPQARRAEAVRHAARSSGFIYKGYYTGQYCVSDEAYVDGPPGTPCPDCGRITETVSEENYFFKLSAFERKLLEFYEANPGFMGPESTRREVISFVRSGLKDLSVSRTSFSWGIPVPGDEKHVVYVWLDALANYITALGYGSDDPDRPGALRKILACRHAPHRQRNQPLPLRLLARVSDGRRHCSRRARCAPTAGCSSTRARCRSRAATSCAPKP